MRNLTNAIVRFSWTLPLFGMKQMLELMTCQTCGRRDRTSALEALEEINEVARRHLSGTFDQTANACERTQRMMSGLIFRDQRPSDQGTATNGQSAPGPASSASQDSQQGWGPIPPSN